MPDISFPSNPSVNDTYSFGGKTWIWTGSYWALNTAGSINGINIGNITPATGAFTTLTSSGNTTLGNIAGNVLPAANMTYDLGSTSQRWNDIWLANSTIYLGAANISASGTAVALPANSTAGGSQIVVESGGSVSLTGNVTAGYFIGNGSQLTGLPASYGNANVVANLAALSSNPISTTGNITANYIIGNGSQLTGLPASYGNANVVANLAALSSNPISTTGNITAGNGIFTGNVTVNNGSAVATLGRTVAFIIAYGA